MKRSKANTLLIVTLALVLGACTATVTRTRQVPVYETHIVNVDGSEKVRRIEVGIQTETYRTREFSWKRTAVGAALAPVVIVAHLLGGLG